MSGPRVFMQLLPPYCVEYGRSVRESILALGVNEIVLGYDGYEDDPRALFQIPEVQVFAEAVLGGDPESILPRLEPESRVLLWQCAEMRKEKPRFEIADADGTNIMFDFDFLRIEPYMQTALLRQNGMLSRIRRI